MGDLRNINQDTIAKAIAALIEVEETCGSVWGSTLGSALEYLEYLAEGGQS